MTPSRKFAEQQSRTSTGRSTTRRTPTASPARTSTSRTATSTTSSSCTPAATSRPAAAPRLSDAIWAHSWDIYENLSGGPGDGPGMIIPGTEGQGPQGKGIWAYNYTINPEDGDVGVFCHEFGHDLGLPDEYDYSSATGDATTGFWTLMSSGSWIGPPVGPRLRAGGDERVGQVSARLRAAQGRQARPHGDRQASGGRDRGRGLHRRQDRTAARQARRSRSAARTAPRSGTRPWVTTSTLVLDVKDPVQVGAGTELSFRTWYDIEDGYDYGFVEVSADGGQTWDTVKQYTGSDMDHWADVQTVDLSAYQGKGVRIRFEYMTDGGVALTGWEAHRHRDRQRRAGGSRALLDRRLGARRRRADADERPLLHRRVPHLRRLRREPPGLLPVQHGLRRAGSTGSATARACT